MCVGVGCLEHYDFACCFSGELFAPPTKDFFLLYVFNSNKGDIVQSGNFHKLIRKHGNVALSHKHQATLINNCKTFCHKSIIEDKQKQ